MVRWIRVPPSRRLLAYLEQVEPVKERLEARALDGVDHPHGSVFGAVKPLAVRHEDIVPRCSVYLEAVYVHVQLRARVCVCACAAACSVPVQCIHVQVRCMSCVHVHMRCMHICGPSHLKVTPAASTKGSGRSPLKLCAASSARSLGQEFPRSSAAAGAAVLMGRSGAGAAHAAAVCPSSRTACPAARPGAGMGSKKMMSPCVLTCTPAGGMPASRSAAHSLAILSGSGEASCGRRRQLCAACEGPAPIVPMNSCLYRAEGFERLPVVPAKPKEGCQLALSGLGLGQVHGPNVS